MRDTSSYLSHRRRRVVLRLSQVALLLMVGLLLFLFSRIQTEHARLDLDLHQQIAAREVRKLLRGVTDDLLTNEQRPIVDPQTRSAALDSSYARLLVLLHRDPTDFAANRARVDSVGDVLATLKAALARVTLSSRELESVATRGDALISSVVDYEEAEETRLNSRQDSTRIFFGSTVIFASLVGFALYAFSKYMESEERIHRNAAENLDEQLAIVTRQSAQFAALLRSIDHPIFALDSDQRLIFWNSAFEQFFRDAAGKPPTPDAFTSHDPCLRILARAVDASVKAQVMPQLHLSQLGRVFNIESSPILYDAIERSGSVILMIDITDQLEGEKDLLQAKNQAEEMNRMKTAFLSNISHELRTPLTTILGFAELLIADAPTEEVRSYAEAIERSGSRLAETLGSLMRLVELESDIRLRPERLVLQEALDRVVQRLAPFANLRHNVIEVLAPEPVEVVADRIGLATILYTVIHNAIKFSKSSTITIRIAQNSSSHATIEIRDRGVGISPEFTKRGFRLFSQESEGMGRTFEGLGIGLAISRRYADLMRAEFSVMPAEGKGTLAVLTLPVMASTEPQPASAAEPPVHHPTSRRPRILVVDDNEEMSELLEKQLQSDYEVYTASDGPAALEIALERSIDVVLLDLDLGEGPTGFDVLHSLRTRPEYGSVPVIAVTAAASSRDHALVDQEGFDDYVSKPYRLNELKTILKRQTEA